MELRAILVLWYNLKILNREIMKISTRKQKQTFRTTGPMISTRSVELLCFSILF